MYKVIKIILASDECVSLSHAIWVTFYLLFLGLAIS